MVTCWNVDLYDFDWLCRRQKVFERFTLPSVEGQKNKNFEWLLISDSRTPDKFKNVLDRYPARIIYYDFEHYDWVEVDQSLDSRMQLAIRIETIGDVVAKAIGKHDTDYVITSRLDNDDILAVEHMDRIQKYVRSLWTSNYRFWFSLVRGYRYKVDAGKVYAFNSRRNSFLSFVEPPTDLKTCYQCCHTQADETGYPMELIRAGLPSWGEVVHGENVLNRVKRFAREDDARNVLGRFSL